MLSGGIQRRTLPQYIDIEYFISSSGYRTQDQLRLQTHTLRHEWPLQTRYKVENYRLNS